ncbi:MAG: hypothetical protein ACKV2Q_25990, partial [Planctomycetaceae bacterium]
RNWPHANSEFPKCLTPEPPLNYPRGMSHIELRGVRVHNLQGIDVSLPLGKLIAITGVSGAGKSSLAFDTLVAEGRRRYIETFAPSARQFLERIERPDADALENLPPAIAFRADATFDQRATLGTMTETDDLLRMLFARLGRAFCPRCDVPLAAHSPDDVCREVQLLPEGTKFVVAFLSEKSDAAIANWRQLGFARTMELPESGMAEGRWQMADSSRSHALRGNVSVDAPRRGGDPLLEINTTAADAERRDARSHAERGNERNERNADGRGQMADDKSQMLIVVDRLVAGRTDAARLLESIEQAYSHGGDRCVVLSEADAKFPWRATRFSRRLICSACDAEFPSLEPDLLNFESPLGACPSCSGLGRIGASDAKVPKPKGRPNQAVSAVSSSMIECPDCGGSRLSATGRSVRLQVESRAATSEMFNRNANGVRASGMDERADTERTDSERAHAELTDTERADTERADTERAHADGVGVKQLRRSRGSTITALRDMRLTELGAFVVDLSANIPSDDRTLVANLLGELSARLRTLLDLGLGHLALNRSPRTLSRGERQRARLAGVLATRLDNALYVLDEPSGGLHPLDAERVLVAIQRLQQTGNTVILVEHSESFLAAADEVLELGPGAGRNGGRVVRQTANEPTALAAGFARATALAAGCAQELPSGARPTLARSVQVAEPDGFRLALAGATLHNLNQLDVTFPLNRLCVVTGVSGSGKSSLIEHTLYPALCQRFGSTAKSSSRDRQGVLTDQNLRPLPDGRGSKPSLPDGPAGRFTALTGAEQIDEVVFLDSTPIRRSARANAATMLSLLAEIRQLFAQTTEAKVKNFTARHFSFNASDGGRCPRCRGLGAVEIDMQFLANLTVVCPECHGSRFQRELLDAKLRGLSIAEVLNLSGDEAFTFFRGQPQLQRRLKSLKDVGLGYLPLGQSASTLSRGECQRLKLATLLANRSRKRTLFLMDEPCAGLHARDIAVLLECFRRLVEVGHSLIVIEHRPEFISAADWVIELGPGAGDAGGQIVAAGTPHSGGESQ